MVVSQVIMDEVGTCKHACCPGARNRKSTVAGSGRGDSISPRHTVMVAGPEKDILRGREFAQGRLEKNESPASWSSEGDSSEGRGGNVRRQTGVIPK